MRIRFLTLGKREDHLDDVVDAELAIPEPLSQWIVLPDRLTGAHRHYRLTQRQQGCGCVVPVYVFDHEQQV